MFDVNEIRKDFPILKRKINGYPLVYLDSAATSQKPKQVLAKVDNFFRQHNANIHRGVHTLSVEATQMVDEARAKTANFIGGRIDETIFVRRTVCSKLVIEKHLLPSSNSISNYLFCYLFICS